MKADLREKAVRKYIQSTYGSIYNSTGGGKIEVAGTKVTDFFKKVASNRLLDIYLKYLGVKVLTTATLVPFALIMGKDAFESYILNRGQVGGAFLDVKIPFIDHPLIGTVMKLADISLVRANAATLVPLGILMIAYDMLEKRNKQKGGFLFGLFGNENNNQQNNNQQQQENNQQQRVSEETQLKVQNELQQLVNDLNNSTNQLQQLNNKRLQLQNKVNQQQTGGSRSFLGADVPQNFVQNATNIISGTSNENRDGILAGYPNKFIENNSEILNTCQNGSCNPSGMIPLNNSFKAVTSGFDKYGIPSTVVETKWVTPTVSDEQIKNVIPSSMAGGSKRKQKGAGSDWMSSQYSLGPVNAPSMSPQQVAAFTKDAIPITSVNDAKLIMDTPLSEVGKGGPVEGYNINGVPTTKYGGARSKSRSKSRSKNNKKSPSKKSPQRGGKKTSKKNSKNNKNKK